MSKLIDLNGKQFGQWIVLSKGKPKNGKTYWTCQCSCGIIKDVLSDKLRSGKSSGCGCQRYEKISKKLSNNLIGSIFGKLTVIDHAETPINTQNKKRKKYWFCKCECGGTKITTTDSLISGDCFSCGCLVSKGEFLISQLLTQKNILFIKEYSFNDLKGKNNKTYLRFDFAIINSKNELQLLLEFHGRQHFKDENNWNGESFKERKHRDNLKSEYCLKNKILLITINYSDDIIEKINNMADLLATGKLSPTKE